MTSVMTRKISRFLLLPTFMMALGILVKGYTQTGDGFSAGVVAGLGVVLQYLAFGREGAERLPLVRYAGIICFAGLLVTLSVAVVPMFLGEPVLTHYPPADAEVIHLGTLEILTAVLFDVGICLLVFGFAVGAIGMLARVAAETGMEGRER